MEDYKNTNTNKNKSNPSRKNANHMTYRSSKEASWRPVDSKKSTSSAHTSAKQARRSDNSSTEWRRNPSQEATPGRRSAYSQNKTANRVADSRKRQDRRRKRGCFPRLLLALFFILLLLIVTSFGLKAAFNKMEKTNLDMTQISINDVDENISDYQNIALFGVDNQDNEIYDKGSRSDCIMIASINKRTKAVKLLSVYRDTYVSIDGNYDKVNAAYSYGGPELAISTLNRNLDLNITDFATVNFKALADAVDQVGGITLTIQSNKERKNLNDYIKNMNKINGGDSPKIEKPDSYPYTTTFDGNQAVAYSRIRYMEGGDHARANHQRLVVQALVQAVKKKPWTLPNLINTVLPQCKTSLTSSELTRLSMNLFRYKIEDSQAYPFDSFDEKYNGIYYGFPTTVYSNVIQAHEYLFGTKDYEPTEELGLISQKVKVISDELE